MRKIQISAVCLVFCLLWGCGKRVTQNVAEPSEATLPPMVTEVTEPWAQPYLMTRSGRILEMLWHFYEEEKFPCCGGSGETFVSDAPGDLVLTDTATLTGQLFLPPEQLALLEDGASLRHMLRSNLFTCGVFRLTEDAQMKSFTQAWRENIHKQAWIGGKPQQLLLMELDSRHILMVLGKQQKVTAMENSAKRVFANSRVLWREGVCG